MKRRLHVPFPEIVVEWDDASLSSEDRDVDQAAAMQLDRRFTKGWLIHENGTRLVVASTVDPPATPDGKWQFSGAWTIPLQWIIARRDVGPRRRSATRRDVGARRHTAEGTP